MQNRKQALISVTSLLLVWWLSFDALAQAARDTVYIMFDSEHPHMSRYETERNGLPEIRFFYKVKAANDLNEFLFSHLKMSDEALEAGMGTDVRTYTKDKSFLKTIKPLNYEWFEKHTLAETDEFFGRGNTTPPMVFIIDKDEIRKCKLKLIQVVYFNPVVFE